MADLSLSDREQRQLRALYALHLNPQTTTTWYHDVISDLRAKGLVRDGEDGMPELTREGLEVAKAL